jgi:hypothetical protein
MPADLVKLVAALIPAPADSGYVEDWPEDEREFYREGDWTSFTDRAEKLARLRQEKAARAILAALGLSPQEAETIPGSWLDEIRDYGDAFRCDAIKAGGACSGHHAFGWGDAMVRTARCDMGNYVVERIAGLRAGINLPGSDEAVEEKAARSSWWHYGPTAADPDPGKMWCYDCGSWVVNMDDFTSCTGCTNEEPG